MKVITKTSVAVDSLFPKRQDIDDFTQSLKDFLSDVVLVQDDDFRKLLLEAREFNVEKYKRFVSYLQNQPLIKSSVKYPDYRLAPPEDLVSARRNPLFLDLLQTRTSQSYANETREEYFERHFGCLIRYAQSIEIHDPWLLGNLNKPNSGAGWLISENLSKFPVKVTLTGAFPKKLRDPRTGQVIEKPSDYNVRCQKLIQGARSRVQELAKCNSNFRLHLRLYDFEGSNKHDRFWRIAFQSGSISAELSDGTETFERPNLPGRRKPHLLNLSEYVDKVGSWEVGDGKPQREPTFTEEFVCVPETGRLRIHDGK